MASSYTDTSGKLARESGRTVPCIVLYADLGLLDYIKASNGVRLFKPGQAARVEAIYAARMAGRGRKA